eukprot:12429519-Karenia_brevis.AAC.1
MTAAAVELPILSKSLSKGSNSARGLLPNHVTIGGVRTVRDKQSATDSSSRPQATPKTMAAVMHRQYPMCGSRHNSCPRMRVAIQAAW